MFFPKRDRCALLLLVLWIVGCLAIALPAQAQGTTGQSIQILPISDRPITSAPFQVAALASSNLPVTLAVQGPATLDDRRLLTLTGPGQVTITATQPGNTQYAAAPTAQLSFNVTAAVGSINWAPSATMPYGTPLSAALLNATATGIPIPTGITDAPADVATVSSQLNASAISSGQTVSYPASAALFRYEGSTVEASSDVPGAVVPNGMAAPFAPMYRVVFTCDCQQFEFVLQSRGGAFRLWVDGGYTSIDATSMASNYPEINFIRVQFPDKRQRQIKLALPPGQPFFGVNTTGADTLSAPQVPVGAKVIVFGDSWTGPTIVENALPPAQDGVSGSGYPQVLGEYFNWDYWDSGIGGEGFLRTGYTTITFPQRLLTDVCPFNPTAVVILGGVNDGGSTQAAMQQAVKTALQNLQTCLPDVPVYLYGPQGVDAATEAAFAAAVPAFSQVHYVDMAASNWFYGTPTSQDTGNAYLYFNGHPTPLGHNYLAAKITADLITAYPALAPVPYALAAPTTLAGTFSYSAAAGALLPAGVDTVTATFTPQDAVNYAPASLAASITVTKASTTTVLAPSTSGASTISVGVQPQIGGVPSGSVQVSEGGTTLATLTLAQGSASYDYSGLAAGAHTLKFAYSGDSNFTASSASTGVTAIAVTPGFTLAAGTSSLTVAAGGQGNVNLLVTPVGGLTTNLGLACTGLPAGASCAFASGSTVAIAGATVTAVAIIKTAAASAALAPGALTSGAAHREPPMLTASGGQASSGSARSIAVCGVLGAGLLAPGLLAVGGRRRRRLLSLLFLVTGLAGMGLAGCGGSSTAHTAPPTPVATSYTVNLTLTDTANATVTQTATVTLVVQ